MKDKIPTERQLLEAILDRYESDYVNAKPPPRIPYIPIDLDAIGHEFGVEQGIIEAMLWHHMERKYGFTDNRGIQHHLFEPYADGNPNVIDFPFAAAIYAGLREEDKRHKWSIRMAALSLVVSTIALLWSIYGPPIPQ